MLNPTRWALLAICLMFHFISIAQVQITHPDFSLAICKENQMEYTIQLPTNSNWPSSLDVAYSIVNLANYPVGCTSNPSHLSFENFEILDQYNQDASSVVNIVNESDNGIVTIHLDMANAPNSNSTYTLRFSLFIDCALIPVTPNELSQILLNEVWANPSLQSQYTIAFPYFSSSLNYTQVGPDINGFVQQNFSNTFYYSNTDPCDVEIKFVNNDIFSCSSSIDPNTVVYEYSIDNGLNWTVFQPNAWTLVSGLTSGNSFKVRQSFTVGCVDVHLCNDNNAHFYWRCAGAGSNASSCEFCQKEYTENYVLSDQRTSKYQITRICPNPAFDISCPGVPVTWAYKIANIGEHSLFNFDYTLQYVMGPNNPSMLTLVDSASIELRVFSAGTNPDWDCNDPLPASNCSTCDTVPGSTVYQVYSNRNEYYTAPGIKSFQTRIAQLDPGDFFIVTFNTIKCGSISQEDEISMFQYEKLFFNKYGMSFDAVNECGEHAQKIDNAQFYGYISNEGAFSFVSGHNMRLGLTFQPSTTDLSVDPGTPAGADGNHADFFVKTRSQEFSNYTNDVFGQSNFSGNSPIFGVLKVVIECRPGLRITTADQPNVQFRSSDLLSSWPRMTYNVFNSSTSPCDSNSYTYYFDFNHFPNYNAFKSFLNDARVDFRLTSCCYGENNPFAGYSVKFYFMPNQASCFNVNYPSACCENDPQCDGSCNNFLNCADCVWYPLSMADGGIHIHCPGCQAPGIIVSGYKMERTSLGLEDSDGNRVADGSGVPITPTYSKYSYLNLNGSNFGDTISDTLRAFFFDGDGSSGGYSYPGNMLSNGNNAVLEVLQLDRAITNMSKMDLGMVDFTFYVDEPNSSPNPDCCDCDAFYGVGNPGHRTLLKLHVSGSQIWNYVQRTDIGDNGQYFFTFHASDLMNVANCSGQAFFTGFQVNQKYRLVCNYKVCGNFLPNESGNATMRISDIRNNMWLSGVAQPSNAFGVIPSMPNTEAEVIATHRGYLDNDNNLIFNPNFEDSVIFWCETFGGRHYYYSTYAESKPYINQLFSLPDDWCTKVFINPTKVFIGTGDNFPFEFKTPQVGNDSLELNIPEFWKVVKLTYLATGETIPVGSAYDEDLQNDANFNLTMPISTPPGTSFITSMANIGLPILQCLTDINVSDTNIHKIGDEVLSQNIIAYLQPTDCEFHPAPPNLNGFLNLHYSSNAISGCHAPGFSPDSLCELKLNGITSSYYAALSPQHPNPNVSINFLPPAIDAVSNTVCWDFNILNPNPDPLQTVAPFIYLTTPASNILGNWTMTFGNPPVTIPNNNGIFEIQSTYPITNGNTNPAYSGTLCAEFTGCLPDDQIVLPAFFGWNCGDYPSSIDSLDSVCGKTPVSLILNKVPYNANLTVDAPTQFNTCENIVVSYIIESIDDGNIYPANFSLGNLPSSLSIAGVSITANNPQLNPITIFDPIAGVWNIWDGVVNQRIELSTSNSLTIQIVYSTQCGFDGVLPEFSVTSYNYCTDSFTLASTIPQLVYNADSCSPACNSCDSLSLSIDQSHQCAVLFTASLPQSDSCAYSQLDWDFGDGSFSNDNNPVQLHVYTSSGNYLVSFTYTCYGEDSSIIYSCSRDTSIIVTCNVDSCSASFDIGQISYCCYHFSSTGSTTDSTLCSQLGYTIFNAGGTLIASYPGVSTFEHCFDQDGVYNICYQYCCPDGTVRNTCQSITVTNCHTYDCKDFSLDISNEGCNYSFTAVLPPGFIGTNVSYCWNMGYNNQTICPGAQTVNFTYPNGTYTVCYKISYFNPALNKVFTCKICKEIEVNCSGADEFCYIIERQETQDEGKVITPLKSTGYLVSGDMASSGPANSDLYFAHVEDDFTSDYHYRLDENINSLSDLATVYSTLEDYPKIYVLGKSTDSSAGNADIVLVCLDQSTQNVLWAKRYGTNRMDIGSKILKIESNALVITGHTNYYSHGDDNYDLFALKVDLNGNLLDVAVYKPKEKDQNEISTDAEIIPNSHNQFVIAGYNVNSSRNRDMIALKINANLSPASNLTIIGDSKMDEWANGIAIQGDYLYLVGASGSIQNESYHIYVAELETAVLGQTLASRLYIPGYITSVANKVIFADNSLYLVGDLAEYNSHTKINHGAILKLAWAPNTTNHLNVLWSSKSLGEQNVRFNHLASYKDLNLIITGTANWKNNQQDIFVVKVNRKNGKGCCVDALNFTKKLFAKSYSIGISKMVPVISTKPYGKIYSYFKLTLICKQNEVNVSTTSPVYTRRQRSGFNIFPNPNSGYFSIKMDQPENTIKSVTIFDMAGHQVFVKKYQPLKQSSSHLEISADKLSGGVYLIQVESMDGKSTQMISITR